MVNTFPSISPCSPSQSINSLHSISLPSPCTYAPLRWSQAIVRYTSEVPPRLVLSSFILHALHASAMSLGGGSGLPWHDSNCCRHLGLPRRRRHRARHQPGQRSGHRRCESLHMWAFSDYPDDRGVLCEGTNRSGAVVLGRDFQLDIDRDTPDLQQLRVIR